MQIINNEIYKINMGTMDDLDVLEEIYNKLNDFLQQGINYPGWLKGIYPVRETAKAGILEKSLFTLKAGDRIAGSLILNHEQEEAYNQVCWGMEANESQVIVIHTLVVNPDFMKQGIAQRLMNFAKEYAKQKNAKAIRLDVAIQNQPAISLYEKCGYTFVGTVDLGLEYEHLKWFKLYEMGIGE